jgi:hypothetical protein
MRIMENTKKATTKKEYFAMVRNIVGESNVENKEELFKFIDHEVELLNKKSSKSGETKISKINSPIYESIIEVLTEAGKGMTASELMEDVRLQTYVDGDKIVKMTNQKLSALLTKLKDDKKLNREEIKKKAYFSIA